MAPDKRKDGEKGEGAPTWDPFLTVALLTLEDVLPGRGSLKRVARYLDYKLGELLERDVVPPPWVVYALIYYREADREGRKDLPPEVVLSGLEWMLAHLPEEHRDMPRRALLEMYRVKLESSAWRPRSGCAWAGNCGDGGETSPERRRMKPTEAPQRTAVDLLLRGIPEDKREEAGRDFLAFVRDYYRHHGAAAP